MSLSVATTQYADPDRLVPVLPSERADTAAAARDKGSQLSMFAEGDDNPSFWDVLDVINPLQHIPVVNKLYQELTGDKIGVGARLAGGTLFGGPIGLIASAINCAIEEDTGKDAGGHLLALFRDDAPDQPATMVAEAKASKPTPDQVAAAPAITLPDVPAKAAGAQMMFGADGTLANPVPTAQMASAPAVTAKPLPLAAAPVRFMPTPSRSAGLSQVNAPPPISVPVSNSGIRSNVPITGRDPVASAPSAMAVQKAMAAQGLGHAEHPMLPPVASAKPAATPPVAPTPTVTAPAAPVQPPAKSVAGTDWLSAMGQALDKYERANSLASKPNPTQVTVQ